MGEYGVPAEYLPFFYMRDSVNAGSISYKTYRIHIYMKELVTD